MNLPCSESATVGALEARLVPGDGQLTVDWTALSGDGEAVDDYDVRYRPDAESGAWTELCRRSGERRAECDDHGPDQRHGVSGAGAGGRRRVVGDGHRHARRAGRASDVR